MTKIFTELYVRKPTGTAWNRVIFNEEQFEELTDFLQEMFPGKEGFEFPLENGDYQIKEI